VGVDSMDIHLSEGGLTTADKVHRREEFRLLISDVQDLPETQRTALLLREIDALSYDQIAEAMETTVPSVKSLLVRARVSLAEASEARQLSCDEVRMRLAEIAEGLRRTTPPLKRHVRDCAECRNYRKQLRKTNAAMAAVFPVGPLLVLKKLVLAKAGLSALAGGAGGGGGAATAGGMATTGVAAGATGGATAGGIAGGAAVGAVASKAVAGLAVTAIIAGGAVEAKRAATEPVKRPAAVPAQAIVINQPKQTTGGASVADVAVARKKNATDSKAEEAANKPSAEPSTAEGVTGAAGATGTTGTGGAGVPATAGSPTAQSDTATGSTTGAQGDQPDTGGAAPPPPAAKPPAAPAAAAPVGTSTAPAPTPGPTGTTGPQ
jgi:Sigma-70, region 4